MKQKLVVNMIDGSSIAVDELHLFRGDSSLGGIMVSLDGKGLGFVKSDYLASIVYDFEPTKSLNEYCEQEEERQK